MSYLYNIMYLQMGIDTREDKPSEKVNFENGGSQLEIHHQHYNK